MQGQQTVSTDIEAVEAELVRSQQLMLLFLCVSSLLQYSLQMLPAVLQYCLQLPSDC
jgi:hypothetical protein